MRTIPLSRGLVALVDDEDYEWAAQFKWCALPSCSTFYVPRTELPVRRVVQMHRLLLNAPPGIEVDHRDSDGLNNQRSNLRLATHAQNQRNRRAQGNNTSGFKGVCLDGKRWRAQINLQGRRMNLGRFAAAEEAARAYDAAAREHHGEFARLNFP